MIEIWKPVAGFDKYEVSNFGRVKSFWHKEPKILKPKLSTSGYLRVCLCAEKESTCYIHRLVAEAFVPNIEDKSEVNHIDGCKTNNFANNLEWVTRSENIQHAVTLGLRGSGENDSRAKITNEQAEWCRTVYKPYDRDYGQKALARKLGISQSTIHDILFGKHYRQASGEFHDRAHKQISDDMCEEIRHLYKRGVYGFGKEALAKRFGIGATTVHRIVNNPTS